MADNWREQLRRGTLDLAVLLVIAPAPRYGLDILRHLEFTDLVLTEGTIYPLLARLEREGVLAGEWVEGEGPRARKYYSLTGRGRRRLADMRDEFRSVTTKIERLLEAADGDR
jgi:PadR family transcriptional regulator, regulatory protein PadR